MLFLSFTVKKMKEKWRNLRVRLMKHINQGESSKQKEEDLDKSFLISLLPYYKPLNDDEKIYFRLLTLQFYNQDNYLKYPIFHLSSP